MAHFYGVLSGSRGQATRCGTKNSGMVTTAASWSGAIKTELSEVDGVTHYRVVKMDWPSRGNATVIASGVMN